MIKKIAVALVLIGIIVVLVVGAVNRTQARADSEDALTSQSGIGHASNQGLPVNQAEEAYSQGIGGGGYGQGAGNGRVDEQVGISEVAGTELDAAEADALTYMREEEKLAYDVYTMLYEKWGLPIFQNISRSELTHTESVATLLERYSLDDPASSEVGVFSDPDLQSLYNDLVSRGSQSLAEALMVGAMIEEMDILDLEEDLAQVDNTDVQQVFNNLLAGSYNHLRSFVSLLQNHTGEVYQPQYLSAEAYQAIISVEAGTGGGGYRGGRP